MPITSPRRAIAAIAGLAAVAAIILTGVPAAGADSDGGISSHFQADSTTIPAHAASPRIVEVDALATGPFTNGIITLDFSGLAGVATVAIDPTAHCTISGTTANCPIADISDDSQQELSLKIDVTSNPAAPDGATGSMSVANSWDGLASADDPRTTDIVVSDSSQLAVAGGDLEEQATVGGDVSEPVSVADIGSKSAAGIQMVFMLSHGIVPDTYDNCLYARWAAIDGTFVACTFPGTVAPGHQVELSSPFHGKIAADSAISARSDLEIFETAATTPVAPPSNDSDFDGATFVARPASGHSLSLLPEAFDGSITGFGFSSGFTWDYRVGTTYDLVADGGHVAGRVGDTVTATIGQSDNGPASLDSWSSHDSVSSVWFTVPGWATVVTVPVGCLGTNDVLIGPGKSQPGMAYYECIQPDLYYMAVGQTFSYAFGLKIKSATGADGIVDAYMYGLPNDFDPNTANDSAKLTLTALGDPTARGLKGRGTSPAPHGFSPSQGGTASATTSATQQNAEPQQISTSTTKKIFQVYAGSYGSAALTPRPARAAL